jgi:excisionase family DNA binding protein
MGSQGQQRLLTVQEVATYLAVNERTIYRLVKEGRMPAFRVGGQWRFKLDLIDGWMRQEQADKYRHDENAMT